jgi:hypothetical protein
VTEKLPPKLLKNLMKPNPGFPAFGKTMSKSATSNWTARGFLREIIFSA